MRIESSSAALLIGKPAAKHKEKIMPSAVIDLAVKKQQVMADATQDKIKEQEAYLDSMTQQLKASGELIKGEKDKLKVLLNCLEISRRILSGDKVPHQDHRYLLKHDPEMYARSISMRRYKNNPHEYKRLTKDEDQEDNSIGGVDGSDGSIDFSAAGQPWKDAAALLDMMV